MACTDNGEVYTWGDNDEGQLGDGTTLAAQRPRLLMALQVGKVIQVCLGIQYLLTSAFPYFLGLETF